MTIGDRVTYRDPMLARYYRGAIRAIGRMPRGGDCRVEWNGDGLHVEECLSNLKLSVS